MIERGDDAFLEKADECLTGAESEYLAGRYNNRANRCYYAVFHAAIWALAQAGIRPSGRDGEWSHEFVISQFNGQLVHRRKRYPASLGGILEQNRAVRRTADYRRQQVSTIQAYRAKDRVGAFLRAMKA